MAGLEVNVGNVTKGVSGVELGDGSIAGLVESLPNEQVAIVQSDATAINLIGLRCHAAGSVAIKLTNDSTAVTWTVTAGEIIYGRIVAVMATNTTLANAEMTGLK